MRYIVGGIGAFLMVAVAVFTFSRGEAQPSGLTLITQVQDRYPRWAPDGETLWFYSNRIDGWDLYRAAADGSSVERITFGGVSEVAPVPSRDGAHVVFVAYDDADEDVWVLDLGTGERTNLTEHPAQDADPEWDHANGTILFTSNRAESYDIWEMNPDGTGLRPLTASAERDGLPSASPNGRYVAFQRTVGPRDAEIFLLDRDTGVESNLSAWEGWDGWPSWSPDGEWILFTSNRSGSSQLWRVRPDGTALEQVTEIGGVSVRRAHWSPDGTRILTNLEQPGVPTAAVAILDTTVLLIGGSGGR